MGICGILWVLQLDVNTYYLGTIIVLVIKIIDTGTKKNESKREHKLIKLIIFGEDLPDKL